MTTTRFAAAESFVRMRCRPALAAFFCFAFSSICFAQEVPTGEEIALWRAIAEAIVEDGRPQCSSACLPIADRTSFPVEQLEALEAGFDGYDCPVSRETWASLLRRLAQINAKSVSLDTLARASPVLMTGERPEYEDFVGFSRVLFLPEEDLAVVSVSLSELSGSVRWLRREGNRWVAHGTCGEWVRY